MDYIKSYCHNGSFDVLSGKTKQMLVVARSRNNICVCVVTWATVYLRRFGELHDLFDGKEDFRRNYVIRVYFVT